MTVSRQMRIGLRRQLATLVERDADAYARGLVGIQASEGFAATESTRIHKALLGAAEIPLETARLCVQARELAATVAAKGNSNAITDAGVAALLAEAGCKGAAYNVRINVSSLNDRSLGAHLERDAVEIVPTASRFAAEAELAVDRRSHKTTRKALPRDYTDVSRNARKNGI